MISGEYGNSWVSLTYLYEKDNTTDVTVRGQGRMASRENTAYHRYVPYGLLVHAGMFICF